MASRKVVALKKPKKPKSALPQAVVEAGEVALGSRAALADWAGIHRSQITRAVGGQDIGGEGGWRLAALAAVVMALLTVFDPEVVPDWLAGLNPHLNDRRPLDVLAAGDIAAVMGAVQSARTGSYA
jgi:uncharacterized protein (DUF2384 family)